MLHRNSPGHRRGVRCRDALGALNAYVDGSSMRRAGTRSLKSLAGTRSWPRGGRDPDPAEAGRVRQRSCGPGAPRSPRLPRMGLRRGLGRPRRRRVAGDGVPGPGRPRARRLRRLERGGLTREMTCGSRAACGAFPLDLGAAGFRLVYLSADDGSAGRLAGYEGRHGCRLALWSGPAPAQAGLAIAKGSRDLRLARWDSEGRHYVLLSGRCRPSGFRPARRGGRVLLTAPDTTDRTAHRLERATGLPERPCAG